MSVNPKLHPDIHWLVRETNEKTGKLKKNISIEQVRQLQAQLAFLRDQSEIVLVPIEKISCNGFNINLFFVA